MSFLQKNTSVISDVSFEEKNFCTKRFSINLEALSENYRFFMQVVAPILCVPVVKSNAYGIGMLRTVNQLIKTGATSFFVSTIEEGITLRASFSEICIYVLQGVSDYYSAAFLFNERLIPVLNSLQQVQVWQNFASQKMQRLSCILNIETGLVRWGLSEKEAVELYFAKEKRKNLEIRYIMSHLACSYEETKFNRKQKENFDRICAHWPDVHKSLGASAALYLGKEYFYDLIRVGRAIYGIPHVNAPLDIKKKLLTVVTLKAKIVKIEEKDFGITRIILGIGYADGYPKALEGKGWGYLNGYRVEIQEVGMKYCSAQLIGKMQAKIQTEEWVELLGEHVSLDEIGQAMGTNAWELLSHLGNRI